MTAEERLIHYLDDAWAVEKALVAALKDMAGQTEEPHLRRIFEEHCQETWQQEERLEERIRALGAEPSGAKGFMNTMMVKFSEAFHAAHDEHDKATFAVMKALAIENLEMAMYRALESYASYIGDAETATMAREHLAREREAADKLWAVLPDVATHAFEPVVLRKAA